MRSTTLKLREKIREGEINFMRNPTKQALASLDIY